jgi:hypothetical protein
VHSSIFTRKINQIEIWYENCVLRDTSSRNSSKRQVYGAFGEDAMIDKTLVMATLTVGANFVVVAPALADSTIPELPGPGAFGLVAMGIAGVFVLARTRK